MSSSGAMRVTLLMSVVFWFGLSARIQQNMRSLGQDALKKRRMGSKCPFFVIKAWEKAGLTVVSETAGHAELACKGGGKKKKKKAKTQRVSCVESECDGATWCYCSKKSCDKKNKNALKCGKGLEGLNLPLDIPEAPRHLCGKDNGILNHFLAPPPQVQELMDFTIGLKWTVGPPDEYDVCDNLPLDEEKEYVLVAAGGGGKVGGLLDSQAAEDTKKQKQGDKKSVAQRFQGATAAIGTILPLCIAVRPCGDDESTWLQQWDFGVYSDPGIVLVKAPYELKIHGLAFSSAGNLQMELNPPLYGLDEQPGGHLHYWMEISLSLPFFTGKGNGQKKPKEIAKCEIIGTFGAYINVNGKTDIAQILDGLLSPEEGSLEGIKSRVPESFNFKFLFNAQAELKLDLDEIFSKKGVGKFEIPASASMMIDAKYSRDNLDETYLAFYFTAQAEIEYLQILRTNDLLEKIIPEIKRDIYFGTYIKLRASGEADFGLTFKDHFTVQCGDGIVKDVLTELLGDLCETDHEVGISVVVKKNHLSFSETCLEYNNQHFCLDVLPSCPAPQAVGDRCSTNADCVSENGGYGEYKKGWCRPDTPLAQKWGTALGCQGRCQPLIQSGAECNARAVFSMNPGANIGVTAEHDLCESGVCFCGHCAETGSKKLGSGLKCTANNDCTSGYCEKGGLAEAVINTGCGGTCTDKLGIGGRCTFNATCKTGHCNSFGTPGECVECTEEQHCDAIKKFWHYCDNYKCHPKKEPFEKTDRDWKCRSGVMNCGICTDYNKKVPNGNECVFDENCQSGCCGNYEISTCAGCSCKCVDCSQRSLINVF